MRKNLDVYANLRPAFCFPALAGASALKPELVEGLDILIVRELTSGVYFGQPKTIEQLAQWRAAWRGYAELHDERDPPRCSAGVRTGARAHGADGEIPGRAVVREIQRDGFGPAVAAGSDEASRRAATAM
jgi:hypothetical protein